MATEDKIVIGVDMDPSGYEAGIEQMSRADRRRAKKQKKNFEDYSKEQMNYAANVIKTETTTNARIAKLRKAEAGAQSRIMNAKYEEYVKHYQKNAKLLQRHSALEMKNRQKSLTDAKKANDAKEKDRQKTLKAMLKDVKKANDAEERDRQRTLKALLRDEKAAYREHARRAEAARKEDARKAAAANKKRGKSFGATMRNRGYDFSKGGMMANLAIGAINLAKRGLREMGEEIIRTETALRKLNSVMGVSDKEMYAMGEALRDVAKETGVAFEEITAGAYQALSTGVGKDELEDFMRTAGQFSKAGFTTAEKGVNAMTTVLNAYGLEMDRATEVTDTMVEAQKQGKFTIDQLSGSLAKVIPIAANTGVSFEAVSAGMVQLTLDGNTTAAAATQLSRLIKELGDDGSKLNEVLIGDLGKGFDQLTADGMDFGDIMGELSRIMEEQGLSADELTESLQSQRGLMSLTKGGADAYKKSLDKVNNSLGTTKETAEGVAKDLKTSFTDLKNELGDLFWNETIKNALQNMVDGVAWAMGEVNKLIGKDQQFDDMTSSKGYRALKTGKERASARAGLNTTVSKFGQEAGRVYAQAIADGYNVEKALIMGEAMAGGMGGKLGAQASGTGLIGGGGNLTGGGESETAGSDTNPMDQYYLDLLRKQVKFEQVSMGIKGLTDNEKLLREQQFNLKMLEEKRTYMESIGATESEMLQNQLEVINAKKALADAEVAVEEEKNHRLLDLQGIAKGTAKEAARALIKDGEVNLEKLGAIALEEVAISAASDGAKSLSIGFAATAAQRYAKAATAYKASAKSFAIAGLAGAGASALNDSMEESGDDYEDDYTEPEEVAEEATKESEECNFFVLQGLDPFVQAIEEHLQNKYNTSMTIEMRGKRR